MKQTDKWNLYRRTFAARAANANFMKRMEEAQRVRALFQAAAGGDLGAQAIINKVLGVNMGVGDEAAQ